MEQWHKQVEGMHQEVMAMHGMHLAMKDEWSRTLEDLAGYSLRLGSMERALVGDEAGLAPKVDAVKGLLRGLTEKSQETHRMVSDISAAVATVRSLGNTLSGYQRQLESVHELSTSWTQHIAKFEPGKLQVGRRRSAAKKLQVGQWGNAAKKLQVGRRGSAAKKRPRGCGGPPAGWRRGPRAGDFPFPLDPPAGT